MTSNTGMQRWRCIWNDRELDGQEDLELSTLIALDGFDSGAGKVDETDWLTHAARVADVLELEDGDSVFEVGCGSGAFLSGLREARRIKIGGLDYSASLVRLARRVFPEGDFVCDDAGNVTGDEDTDFVVAHGVFHYFKLDYADQVLRRMIKKARKAVCILDVPDEATKEAAEAARRAHLSPEEYERKYAGLMHTYFGQAWFAERAEVQGCELDILPGMMPNYVQADYRFGVVLRKGRSKTRMGR